MSRKLNFFCCKNKIKPKILIFQQGFCQKKIFQQE
jgi:hypothetical protein